MTQPNGHIGPRAAIVFATILPLAACASEPEREVDMGNACQTRQCVCTQIDAPFYKDPETARVLWVSSGEAYCPDGFKLGLAPEKKK